MASKSKVCFFFENTKVSLSGRTKLKSFITAIFKKEGKQLESLNYIFTTDKNLIHINKKYLNHNTYTDIITFDLSESHKTIGEVYISVDRIRENCKELKTTFRAELHRVIFHGALHLCGYNDKTQKERSDMRMAEDHYLFAYLK